MFNTQKFLEDLRFAIGDIADVSEFANSQKILTEKAGLQSVAALKKSSPSVYAIKGTVLPAAIQNYGDFMLRTISRSLTGADLAKAQMITLSSIQRGAIDMSAVQASCSRPGDPMFQAIAAVGITPDCFNGGFFVSEGGYVTQKKGSKNSWFPSIRPEDTMARFVQIEPSADVFIGEMLRLVAPARQIAAEEWSKTGFQTPEFLTKMRLNKRIQAAIDGLPGGLRIPAAVEAQLSPQSQRYLEVIYRVFGAFGLDKSLKAQLLTFLPTTLVYQDMIFDLLRQPSQGYLLGCYFKSAFFKGAGIAKIPFTAAMLGRGDLPVIDAREIDTWFSKGKYVRLSQDDKLKLAAIPMLADRLEGLRVQMPKALEPFRQYLTHHYVWDASEGSDTMHTDMIRAIESGKFRLFGFLRRP